MTTRKRLRIPLRTPLRVDAASPAQASRPHAVRRRRDACAPLASSPPTGRSALPLLVAALAGLAGCATPGPLHLYTLAESAPPEITDHAPAGPLALPSFVAADERVVGFAYDPFTDHFFLRLAPGDTIRVVDRPARAVKREFAVPALARAETASDLAVRPRDGHVFVPHPRDSALVELTRLGKVVRTIPLAGFDSPPIGIALDLTQKRLLTLREKNGAAFLQRHAPDGALIDARPLPGAKPGPIAYDSERAELYAPLAGAPGFGVFDNSGQLRRAVPAAAAFIDLGPRSFIRVF